MFEILSSNYLNSKQYQMLKIQISKHLAAAYFVHLSI